MSNNRLPYKEFDWDMRIDKSQLPDPQNFHQNEVAGGQVRIDKVGISNLDLPFQIETRNGAPQTVHGKLTGYVSLDDPQAKGINMSRLVRGLYEKIDGRDKVNLTDFIDVVEDYRSRLPAENAYLKVDFNYAMKKPAIREPEVEGWLVYPVSFEIEDKNGEVETWMEIKYNYASACPCSYQLAQHSVYDLNTPSISHSQPSTATIRVKFDPSKFLWIEEIVELARKAVPTELLQGIVSRVGEFSFAQLVAANQLFVEDAARRFYATFDADSRILDFVIDVEHRESLNQNWAVAQIRKHG